MKQMNLCKLAALCMMGVALLLSGCNGSSSSSQNLVLNDSSYFEATGLNVFVFSNMYDVAFDDSKMSAIELIHHGVRTVTNGDVRLNPTPGQWDPLPLLVERKVDKEKNRIDVLLNYDKYDFQYTLTGEARDGGFYISVNVDKPVPEALNGVAGLNIEFTPAAYFGKSYIIDTTNGVFPGYPSDQMETINGQTEPIPFATGRVIAVAPDDPERHITISSPDNDLLLFDGRNKAQNGWFVLRSLLPAGKTGKIVEWFLTAETIPNWTRQPVIAHSQVGYHPAQAKKAVIELDKNDKKVSTVNLLKIASDGKTTKVLSAKPQPWGQYLRYNYLTFDFSSIQEPGIYVLEYGDVRTAPFPVATDVYQRTWQSTLDVFFPVQMDHVYVREGYRVWHGASHLDDALQAPANLPHWDGWRQAEIKGKYKALQHIPYLNVGGWYDAGDFDIQTPSQHSVVQGLVDTYEYFNVTRDETTISQKDKYVEMHLPDGTPDIPQQVAHGALQLIGQVKAFGYAIQGINESHLYQYRHLGDAVTKTDNITGNEDDRWAFSNTSPYYNYGTATSLAGASRILKGYDEALSKECLTTAQKLWKDEHSRPFVAPTTGRTFGGFNMADWTKGLELRTAFELWKATDDPAYKAAIDTLLPPIEQQFDRNVALIARLIPYLGDEYKQKIAPQVKAYAERLAAIEKVNPFGVAITTSLWAGNRGIISVASTCFLLYQSFPDLIDPEYIYRGLTYIYGTHPDSDISFVSAIGAVSKKVAYGNNRADFTFIAGGVVPGVRIINTDFPENRSDYPFIWSENEYVIDIAANYIFLANAVNSLLK
jgi:hypothetical protein